MKKITMKLKARCVIASAVAAMVAIGYLVGQQPAGKSPPENAGKPSADTDAIKKAGQSFVKAYLAGDARAMAAHWTENGEYFADDGTILRGRADIEKSYDELFTKKGGHT